MQPKLLTEENCKGDIWRMEIDEISDTLFLEIRDPESKKVHFSAINLRAGHTIFRDLAAPEQWLTGMEAAYNGVLLLHFYQTETGPTHKGLMAIDAQTGKTLWSDYSLSFDYLAEKGPVVYDSRIFPRKLFLLDIKTGATTRVYEPSVYKEIKNSVMHPEQLSG